MREPTGEPTRKPFALEGVIRRPDWGSRTSIQRLLGEPVDGRPAAELWLGAHQADPSTSPHGPLDAVIAADPKAMLGQTVIAQFGPKLPFLLKILAAETALSIQVHPTRAEAEAGFDAEDAARIPVDAPNRNYRDRNHKPELLCALTPFEALCGFRPATETLALLEQIALPQLGFLADALRGPDPLRAAFRAVLTAPDPAGLARAVASAAEQDDRLRPASLAAEHFAGDVGVVLTLLLNHVVLEPGEAIYLGAGNVHAYLRGTGVEIMANSDNVLRCGLTAKHIDVEELARITDFRALPDPRWPAVGDVYAVPVPDFALRRVQDGEQTVTGPAIALCVEGSARVGEESIGPGHAVFVPAGPARLVADGVAFVASVGGPTGGSA